MAKAPSPKVTLPKASKVKLPGVPKVKSGKSVTPSLSNAAGLKNYLANSKSNLFT